MGQVVVGERHVADIIGIGDFYLVLVALAVCPRFRAVTDFRFNGLGQGVLLFKEHGKVALYLVQHKRPAVERGEDRGQHIGVMADFVQIKTVLIIAGVQAFVVVKLML